MNIGQNTREPNNLYGYLQSLTYNSNRTKESLRAKIVKEAKDRFSDQLDRDDIIKECEQCARLGCSEYTKEFTIESNHPAYKLKYFEAQAIINSVMTEIFKNDGLKIEVAVSMAKKVAITIAWY